MEAVRLPMHADCAKFILMVSVSFLSCHINRDKILCASYLLLFIQETLNCSYSAHYFPEMKFCVDLEQENACWIFLMF